MCSSSYRERCHWSPRSREGVLRMRSQRPRDRWQATSRHKTHVKQQVNARPNPPLPTPRAPPGAPLCLMEQDWPADGHVRKLEGGAAPRCRAQAEGTQAAGGEGVVFPFSLIVFEMSTRFWFAEYDSLRDLVFTSWTKPYPPDSSEPDIPTPPPKIG